MVTLLMDAVGAVFDERRYASQVIIRATSATNREMRVGTLRYFMVVRINDCVCNRWYDLCV